MKSIVDYKAEVLFIIDQRLDQANRHLDYFKGCTPGTEGHALEQEWAARWASLKDLRENIDRIPT